MDHITLGVIIGAIALGVMLTGLPIAFSLGLVSLGIIYFLLGPLQFEMVGETLFNALGGFELLSIPLFVFMGAIFAQSKASSDLFDAATKWLHKLPGGLAISSVVASAIFAALCGSSPATAAAIGNSAIPEMRKRGYPNHISTGAIVAGGTLGILIPPSVTMILYGIAVEQSIGRLFMAGIIPGIMLTIMFSIWIIIAVWLDRKGFEAEAAAAQSDSGPMALEFTWGERMRALWSVWPFVVLIIGILASLYMGIATPSEAAAVGAVFALILVSIVYRNMNWKNLKKILLSATNESTMILMIMAMALLFSYAMSYLYIPQKIAEAIIALDVSQWIVMIIINIFLLILGFFIPPAAIIVMIAPIIYPIIVGLGWDPIWFGVIMTLNMEAGLITPPVGLNLYVVKGIAPEIPLTEILRGSIPYIAILVLGIVLLCVFPQLALWLPNKLFGV